jgi:hypothetical protein
LGNVLGNYCSHFGLTHPVRLQSRAVAVDDPAGRPSLA